MNHAQSLAASNFFNSLLDGVPGHVLKEKGEYIVKRRAELEAILESVEEASVVFHPNVATRYHEEVGKLIDALNVDKHREEAAELLRTLVDKILLTPAEGKDRLTVDLIGDLAGILSMATKGDEPLVESGLSWINESQKDSVVFNCSDKEAMVEGARNTRVLPTSDSHNEEALVAGAGFEPATFRL